MSNIFINPQDEEDPIEDEQTELVEGDYISINLGSSETEMKKTLKEYNKLCSKYMPEILKWTHLDLLQHSTDKSISLKNWRDFILDTRVKNWIKEELSIIIQSKQLELLNKVGDDRSTATVQALSAIMRIDNEDDANRIDDNKIFIYSFMPLTDQERRLNNAQVLDSIPIEVKRALQYISPDDSDKDN